MALSSHRALTHLRRLTPLRRLSTDSTISIETSIPFTGHNIDPPSRNLTTSPSELMTFFHDMALMRRMEIAADSLYKAKLIRGFCHLYDGQEAVAIGMEAAITKKDCIITAYSTVNTDWGVCGADGEEGGMFEGERRLDAFLFEGEGVLWRAWDCGGTVLFEALNMAALWDLPAILVCENNHYGMGTAEWRAAKSPSYYKRGDYVPGLKVDGMDAFAVKQACAFAKEHVLKMDHQSILLHLYYGFLFLPRFSAYLSSLHLKDTDARIHLVQILEMDTYRYHGHSMSDPGSTYRTRDEISGVRQERDPIERIRKLILAHDIATEKELKDIEKEIRKEVDEAIAKAKESPMPDSSELFTNVYSKGLGVEVCCYSRIYI
ncbi:hypothetical protein Leryth_021091 [Lithospermum erythrorhizon]|nr:hypothetical protein Leryth_021091 [Lithospermum erythrorhizon]